MEPVALPPMFFRMEDFSGYGMAFSPFMGNRLAIAASQYYGIVGNGRLYVLDVTPEALIVEMRHFDTQDGLYDVVWSEENENQVLACSGDGSIKLWDVSLPSQRPIMSYEAHATEVYGVDWELHSKELFSSCSWDGAVMVWDATRAEPLTRLLYHQACVYESNWSPHRPHTLMSCSADNGVSIWDTRQPQGGGGGHDVGSSSSQPPMSWTAHGFEVLSCDWNKYRSDEVVTASVDKTLRIWDIRRLGGGGGGGRGGGEFVPLQTLHGHSYAVRRVRYSPHCADMICSSSYDMSVVTWNAHPDAPEPIMSTRTHHTEFAVGIDWNLFSDMLGSCGWDSQVALWHQPAL